NMEQPRAFGGAFALGNGDVLLAGGFGGLSGGNLIASGRATDQTRIVRDLLAEARWFRQVGRGRIFLQAMVLRRTR
ncbi:MAG: hypothetical protein KC620_27110, partial [Myxococcales bacterium]|nr:hypothetical protein [Myxococcales bacterium]